MMARRGTIQARFDDREALFGHGAGIYRPPTKPAAKSIAADAALRRAELAALEAAAPKCEFRIERDASGLFHTTGTVNGVAIRFLVDTGANMVVLSIEDAARAGIRPSARDFTRTVETISGIAKAAPIDLASICIGPATLSRVRAQVMRTTGGASVFGMSGLNHLAGYDVRDDVLTLRW